MITINIDPIRIRVILADDHPAVRAGIRQFIERDPLLQVVAEADDGIAALDLMRRHQPDVAVLDLQMPGLSGLEVITRAAARFGNTTGGKITWNTIHHTATGS